MNTLVCSAMGRRELLKLAVLLPWIAGCSISPPGGSGNADPQRRFRGIGLTLVVDAVPGTEMRQVRMTDDRNAMLYSSETVAKRNREIMAFGSARVPLTVTTTWREGAGWDSIRKVWNEGTVVGNYTIPVAERIPDDVLNGIRTYGGGLRLKFRLKPDGVLFGWDIARPGGGITKFDMPGGDFLETRYY